MGSCLLTSYVWYMSACTTEALCRPDGDLYVKKMRYTRIAFAACLVMLLVDIFFSVQKCIKAESLGFMFAYFHMAQYTFLMLLFVAAALRLMVTLRTGFYAIYNRVRCRIIAICVVGAFALSVRIVLSIVYSFYASNFNHFKERSLLEDTSAYPAFLGTFAFFSEIVPLVSFELFLAMPKSRRL